MTPGGGNQASILSRISSSTGLPIDQMLLYNPSGVLGSYIVIPDAVGVDDHKRPLPHKPKQLDLLILTLL
ncbi:hypothetical protein B9T62_38580 [Paenibacillus donghaensis]|uniref:Uncharacterized protein n=1 Tax=Paenibacillus donghaensis TaxID=414771 RepID=A0A2Z2KV65_9BACL|nr:hypothetical protein B9T62_38580 [Paenibacillus donghaensis]